MENLFLFPFSCYNLKFSVHDANREQSTEDTTKSVISNGVTLYHFFYASGSFTLTFALKRFTFLQKKWRKCVPLPQSSLWPISNHVLCIVTLHETNCNHCNQILLFTRMYIESYAHNSLFNTFIWKALPFYLPSLFS